MEALPRLVPVPIQHGPEQQRKGLAQGRVVQVGAKVEVSVVQDAGSADPRGCDLDAVGVGTGRAGTVGDEPDRASPARRCQVPAGAANPQSCTVYLAGIGQQGAQVFADFGLGYELGGKERDRRADALQFDQPDRDGQALGESCNGQCVGQGGALQHAVDFDLEAQAQGGADHGQRHFGVTAAHDRAAAGLIEAVQADVDVTQPRGCQVFHTQATPKVSMG